MIYLIKNPDFPLGFITYIGSLCLVYTGTLFALYGPKSTVIDPLNHKIINIPYLNWQYSLWPITHFIFYLILGYYYPQYIIVFMIMGIFWELFEMCLGKIISCFIKDHPDNILVDKIKNIQYTTTRLSSYSDIVFNTLGLITGYFFSTRRLVV